MNKEDFSKTLDYKDLVDTIKGIKNRNRKNFLYRIIPELFLPCLIVLAVISTHSNELIIAPAKYVIYSLLIINLFLFIFGMTRYKDIRKGRTISIFKMLVIFYAVGCSSFLFLLYGPYQGFKEWLISTSMATMNHQYICKWFYGNNEIVAVLDSNYVVEILEETNTDLINVDAEDTNTYDNAFEEAVLKRDKGQEYKIIEMQINGCKAYLSVIYNPAKVGVAITGGLGNYGQYVTTMAETSNAVLATNGGGFYDPGNSSKGGMPTGITIADGKIITDNNYSGYTQSGGLIGLTDDNKLVLMKNTTGKKAVEAGIRDGVSWGPFLIVNGKQSFIKGNGGWGYAARTAIGQRKDGIILLLVVDSNSTRTKGADMVDLTEIMYNYGAINAANLDGGTSSVLVLPKKESLNYINSCDKNYCYINDPIDSTLSHRTRGIATSIIVRK